MKNKSVISLLIAFTLLVTLTIPIGVTAAPKEAEEEPAEVMTQQITTVYEENKPVAQIIKKNGKVVERKNLKDKKNENSKDELFSIAAVSPTDPNDQYVDVGSKNYYLIETWYGDSAVIDTMSEWVSRFAAGVIPAMLTGNLWAAAAGQATFETFYEPPSRRYYTNKTYEAQDAYFYYGRKVTYEYSNSSRTSLTRTDEFVYRIYK